jgi:hypothetical protein
MNVISGMIMTKNLGEGYECGTIIFHMKEPPKKKHYGIQAVI